MVRYWEWEWEGNEYPPPCHPLLPVCSHSHFLLSPEEANLLLPARLLKYELQRALCESHLWLSLFHRPARSPFTRLQRATCCTLLLQLLVLANTLWYSIVVDVRSRCRNLFFCPAACARQKNNCCFLVSQPSARVEVGCAGR